MNLGHEDETLEFKKSTGELNEAMNSISAMLNKHGRGRVECVYSMIRVEK